MQDPLREDFRVFVTALWLHLGLPKPTRTQYDIARRLQKGPRRHIIQAFRGVGKSYLTAAYVLWRLYCDPQVKVMVVSANADRAHAFATFTRRIIEECEWLSHLRPGPGQRDSVISYDVGPATADQSPSVKSVGITGQMTGSRADLIVADDVEVPSNSFTQLKRERIAELVKEFDAVLKPDGQIIYLGTPQTEESLYTRLQDRGYECMIWPARYPTEKQRQYYGARLAPLLANDLQTQSATSNQPVDPARFDEEDLIERELSYGKAGWALQFMLDTSLSDADKHPLKLRDLILFDVDADLAPNRIGWSSDPDYSVDDLPVVGLTGDGFFRAGFVDKGRAAYHGTVMAIDPSGRGKDRTGVAIVSMLNGYLYVHHVGGLEGGYEEPVLLRLAKLARDHGVNRVLVEPNFGGGMFARLLAPVLAKHHAASIEDAPWSNVQKERRICDTLEPVLARHRLVVDIRCLRRDYDQHKDAPEDLFHMFAYQLTRMTREKGALRHDDAVDALSMAVGYWTERMTVDAEQQAKDREVEALQRELNAFLDGTLLSDVLAPAGQAPGPPNWMEEV